MKRIEYNHHKAVERIQIHKSKKKKLFNFTIDLLGFFFECSCKNSDYVVENNIRDMARKKQILYKQNQRNKKQLLLKKRYANIKYK